MNEKSSRSRPKVKTRKCIKFLDKFTEMRPLLNGESEEREAIVAAMREAGYKQTDDTKLVRQGKELLAAYDKLTENAKDVFDSVGLSARRIAELLRDIAQNGKSETARVQALNIATKCLGLQRETPDLKRGAEVVIVRHNDSERGPKLLEKAPTQVTEVTSIFK